MQVSTPVAAQLCAQVQKDTIKVVVDRKTDHNCDIGNFELLWRQPSMELPPFHGSDLCVEGVSMRKAKKQMPAISKVNFSPSILDTQPLEARCSSATPDLPLRPPQSAIQQDPRLRDDKAPPRTLPAPAAGSAERGCEVQSIHAESGGKVEFPTCNY
ncbi:hypothetical protein MC885_000295 [Smutsia gigantea]|nr:hypothetical protein MC885_000295 [Smutsia gigantea]